MQRVLVVIWVVAGLILAAQSCVDDDIPRTATGASCQDSTQCPMVGCDCANNTVVLAQHCLSFRCQTADDTCAELCEDRGGWTRRDAGEFFCASDEACLPVRCECVNDEVIERGFCFSGMCMETLGEACFTACMDAGGYADCVFPGDTCLELPCCVGVCDGTGICVDEGSGRP